MEHSPAACSAAFRKRILAVLCSLFVFLATASAQSCSTSITGTAVPSLAAFDTTIQSVLTKYSIAGASLSVAYQGRLVFARGYGCADKASNLPAKPDSLFRIASASKTFTAIGVLQLVQQGKLSLDTLVFGSILTDYVPLPGKTINPDLMKITVRNLLQMTGGWDPDTTQQFNGTPYTEPVAGLNAVAAQAVGNPPPATDADIIRVMLSQPIQHAPGTFYVYSNWGYILLGRVIEHVSGMGYEQYVQQNILKPLGIGRQKLGATLQSDTVNGEVTYYDYPGAPLATSVFPFVPSPVPAPYGSALLEDIDATGAWVTTTVDEIRFLNGIVGMGGGTALLNAQSIALMQTLPVGVTNETPTSFYGLGFGIVATGSGFRWVKDGGLAGTSSFMSLNQPANITWAAVFNGSSNIPGLAGDYSGQITTLIGQLLNSNSFPSNNLLSNFQSTLLTPTFSTTDPPVTDASTNQPGMFSGSWVSIKGQNLATATRTWWPNEVMGSNLPVEIDHVRVSINGKDAPVYYVSPNQLLVRAPVDSTVGPVNVQVTRDGAVSAALPANYLSGSGAVAQLLPQAVAFAPLSNVLIGATFSVSATSTSGLSVSLASVTPAVCTISGTTVKAISAGACSITASQRGDGSYLSAVSVTQTLVVTAAGGANNYYFADLAFAGGFKTTLTLINYSPQAVTCTTSFYSNAGTTLAVPFAQGTVSTRTDVLAAGGSIHDQTVASLTAAVTEGWGQSSCSGPIQASLVYRYYINGVAASEAGVNAETAPTTSFVTFAQTATGVAYGNPSATQTATVTFSVFDTAGVKLGTKSITLGPLAHGSSNLGPLLGLANFTGMVQITSTIPIISLSLNAEAFPVISSLPPGDLPGGFNGGGGAANYYFSHLAFAGGFQTTLTLINYSPQSITCTTNFYSDAGALLSVPFSQVPISTRTDVLPAGGSVHDQTIASLTAAVTAGWARSSCTGPVQASLVYRYYTNGIAASEAGVNAETAPTTSFVTFAQTATGAAYANPSATQTATVTFTVYNTAGMKLGSQILTLGPLAHSAANLGPLLSLSSFTGFVKITSTIPIISLSLNAEAFPVISSLPPGDLPNSTTLITP